jgi:hemerythrin
MYKILWKNEFETGVPEIDEQHKQLIKLLNDLIDTKDLHVSSDEISKALYAIINYADVHFGTEELFLQQINYPKYAEHKKEHTLFRKMAVQFCQETVEKQKDVPHEMITFLTEWTIGHILYSDQDYKKFIEKQKQLVE